MSQQLITAALQHLLRELGRGPTGFGNWLLDRDAQGYAGLAQLSAAAASKRSADESQPENRASIAAHVRHATYGLTLLNRWAQGEENPFADADWAATWDEHALSDSEWQREVQQLLDQLDDWSNAVAEPREWDEISLTGAVASVAHLAYHLGAIAQHR